MIEEQATVPVPELETKARPSEKVFSYWLGRTKNVTTGGRKVWGIKFYDVGGEYRKDRLGLLTKKAAKKALYQRQRDVERAKDKKAEKPEITSVDEFLHPKPAPSMKLAEFVKTYLDDRRADKKRDSTIDRYEEIIKNHIEPALGKMPIGSITTDTLDDYIRSRRSVAQDSTVLKDVAILSGMFQLARKKKATTGFKENPIVDATKPKAKRKKPDEVRFLDKRERGILLARAPKHLRPVIITALWTGLREGELTEAQWTWIDWHRKEIMVPADVAKNGTARKIGLCNRVLEALKALQRDGKRFRSSYIFVSKRSKTKFERFNSTGWRKTVAQMESEGIRHFRFHDLRATFCVMLAEKDIHMNTIKELAGHADITTTALYVAAASKTKRAAIDAFNEPDQPTLKTGTRNR